ncbi:MAG: aminoacyl--tRNA ligase-related protein [Sulfolobales archaeon]
MKYRGTVRVELSRDLAPGDLEDMKKALEEVNRSLAKGFKDPEEGGKVVNWSYAGRALCFEVESRRLRIDEAAMRIKNSLETSLGSMRKIGVRSIRLEDALVEIDGEIRINVRLPFVRSIKVSGGSTTIHLEALEEKDLKKPILLRLLRLLNEKETRARWGGKAEHWQLIKKSEAKLGTPPYAEDPNKILEETGLVKRFSTGQWLYTPLATYLLNMMKDTFLGEVVLPLGFTEAVFPKMYPLEVGLKTGHLRGTINSMVFASLPKTYNIEEFEELTDYIYVANEAPPEEIAKYLRYPEYFLCFAQCEPFYWFFGNELLDDLSLPIKWFDKSGPSFRWESGGIYGLERVIEFHRVEVVWLGKPNQVIEIRNNLLNAYEKFMDEVLELEWRTAWVTPWYYEQSGATEKIEEFDINRPGTIDFELWLPYKGPREEHKAWLEVGNISIHGTKFTEPFRIKHNKGETLWTGCSGFGSQRWLIAFLAQRGFDPEGWPKIIREYLDKNPPPEPVIMVTYPKTRAGREELDKLIKFLKR